MPASTAGKNVLPRAAALMRTQPITDVISILSESKFKRPIYAGNAIATVERIDNSAPLLMTIRPTSFESAAQGSEVAPIEDIHDEEVDAVEVGVMPCPSRTLSSPRAAAPFLGCFNRLPSAAFRSKSERDSVSGSPVKSEPQTDLT